MHFRPVAPRTGRFHTHKAGEMNKTDAGVIATPERMATAYHEAGHAVISHFLRVGVKLIELGTTPGVGHAGMVHHYKVRRNPQYLPHEVARPIVEPRICILLAGKVAESRFVGRAADPSSHRPDDKAAAELAAIVTFSQAECSAYLRWLLARTRELVRMLWASIEAVAAAVAQRGRLTGVEMKAVLRARHKAI